MVLRCWCETAFHIFELLTKEELGFSSARVLKALVKAAVDSKSSHSFPLFLGWLL